MPQRPPIDFYPSESHCVAVIPCKNEAAAIAQVVSGVKAHLSKIIVVDDGSTDDTARLAAAAGAHVALKAHSSGKGRALVHGWEIANQWSAEWVLLMDGDGQHAAADIPKLFAKAKEGVRLVIGNRMENAGSMPWLRRGVNRWISRRISELTGVDFPDSQCGFRLVHLPTLRWLSLKTERFEIESEMCFRFAQAGCLIASAPVGAHYGMERSKIAPAKDTARWLWWYFCARRARGRALFAVPEECGSHVQPKPASSPIRRV